MVRLVSQQAPRSSGLQLPAAGITGTSRCTWLSYRGCRASELKSKFLCLQGKHFTDLAVSVPFIYFFEMKVSLCYPSLVLNCQA